jgi:hypothetical protein
LLAYMATNIIWLFLMITPSLCGLFLSTLNLSLFLLCQIFSHVSTYFGRTIKASQCDNDREFDNGSSHAFFTTKGVLLRMFCLYTSPQNSKTDHILCTINNTLRSLLFQTSIPACYWVEPRRSAQPVHTLPSKESPLPMSTCAYSVVPSIPIYPEKSLTNWHPGTLDVFYSDTPVTTKVTGVLISPPPTSSSPDTLFFLRQIFPSPHPV